MIYLSAILSMSEQTYVFLGTVIFGFAAGFAYDILRILRSYIKHTPFIVHAQDVLFWLFASIAGFYFILNYHDGQFRSFYFLGTGLGMVIYFVSVSRAVRRVTVTVVDFVLIKLRAIFRVIFAPIAGIYKFISKPFRKILKLTKKHLQNTVKYAKIKVVGFCHDLKIILKKI
ncbi:MAG: spore cortex biosynthesis protein YabQ [Defluviitaleaceae bacterium]|nr:spore cortex biosynthesis protein YabQ [Defluviitaleaceae bacterium]